MQAVQRQVALPGRQVHSGCSDAAPVSHPAPLFPRGHWRKAGGGGASLACRAVRGGPLVPGSGSGASLSREEQRPRTQPKALVRPQTSLDTAEGVALAEREDVGPGAAPTGLTLLEKAEEPGACSAQPAPLSDADKAPSSMATTESDDNVQQLLFMSKSWYFLTGASTVFFIPYLMLYFKQELHFSEAQLGTLSALRPWLGSASMFAGTAIADALSCHQAMLIGCIVTSTALRLSLFFVGGGFSAAAVAVAADVFAAPVIPFVDGVAVKISAATGESYGSQRLWTSVAYGFCAIAAGWGLQTFGFQANFIGYAALSAPLILVTWQLSNQPVARSPPKEEPKAIDVKAKPVGSGSSSSSSIEAEVVALSVEATGAAAAAAPPKATLKDVLADAKVWALLFQCLIQGVVGPGLVGTFLFIYMKDLGASPTLTGSLISLDCLVEVMVFNSQATIMRHVSADRLLQLSQGAMVLQLLGYSMARNPMHVAGVEVLQGVAFACGWSAVCAKAKELAPPGMETTLVGLVSAAYFGVGQGMGSLLGGLLLEDDMGWSATFQVAAALVLTTLVSAAVLPPAVGAAKSTWAALAGGDAAADALQLSAAPAKSSDQEVLLKQGAAKKRN